MPFLFAVLLLAQNFTHRGFLESQFTVYPQKAPNDSGRIIAEELVRYEGIYKPVSDLEISAGIDLRIDTHHQVERKWRLSWDDREPRRPTAAIRNLRVLYSRGGITIEAGKQFVRWGKSDIVTPTDRFAPRDFLAVVDNDFLPTPSIRATYEHGANTIDAIWSPRFTPSRTPLRNQRWFPEPGGAAAPRTIVAFPHGEEVGVRWNHAGTFEYSVSFYQGFNHGPSYEYQPNEFVVQQFYPGIRMFGGDAAIPFRWLTAKIEAAYFDSRDGRSDEYVQYVVQLERQTGEWSFVGGYAGEVIANRAVNFPSFDPDRGLTKTLLGRAGYTIDANRSVALETAVRQGGNGVWTKFEYSHAIGQHWRATTGFGLIAGKGADFLGQYRRNSHGLVAIRYSF